jgi:hypothetical protein
VETFHLLIVSSEYMNEIKRINEIVETTNAVDFRIQSYDSVNLIITGSFDFCYYHEVEFNFHEVSYISLPAEFSCPKFRLGTADEAAQIGKIIILSEEQSVFCIEAETTRSFDRTLFFVVADKVSIKEGLVFYYERENLKEGERIAPWVKGSS